MTGALAVIYCRVSTIRKVVMSRKCVDEIIDLINNGDSALVEEKRRKSDTEMCLLCVVRVPAGDGAQGELWQTVASPRQAGPLEPPRQHPDPHAHRFQIRRGSVCLLFICICTGKLMCHQTEPVLQRLKLIFYDEP